MRWQRLFDDLEAQLDAAQAAAVRADVAEQTRAERARVALADRVRASRGARLRVHVGDVGAQPEAVAEGVLVDAAVEWFVLADDGGAQLLVPTAAVCAVRGLGPFAAPAAGAVERRLGLGHVLRALARDRAVVRVLTGAGPATGRIDAVGADHLDLVGDREGWVLPFSALRLVRST